MTDVVGKGKGYPDLTTVQFLNLIHSLRPHIPVLCVVDWDPHGIEIMRMFKYGSKNLIHEENARVAGLQWLGVRMGDILETSTTSPNEQTSYNSTVEFPPLTNNEDRMGSVTGKSTHKSSDTPGQ